MAAQNAHQARQRLSQLTATVAPTPTESTPVVQTRATIAARMARDPGLPVPSPTMSYWQDPEHSFAHVRSTALPKDTDVALIGSGITAVSTAQHLLRLEPSLRIVILEARSAISGATGRNGGHIKASPWADYHDLKQLFGKQSGMKIIKFRMAHLDVFCREAVELGDAGQAGLVRRTKALSTSYSAKAWEGSKLRLQDFLQDFPEEVGKWEAIEDRATLRSLGLSDNAVGTVRGPEGAAWPYRFVGAVMGQLLDGGQVTLETHTPVTSITRTPSRTHPYSVHTSRGSIDAKHVVHCTNGFAAHLLPSLRGKLWPFRGQMTVQSVPRSFPRLGGERSWSTVWERGFDYVTQSPGPDGCLYWGGGLLQVPDGVDRELDLGCSNDGELSYECLSRLANAAGRAFKDGEHAQIVRKWTGIMGCTGDGLPLVDRLPEYVSGRSDCDPDIGGEWIAAGFNGFGMVNCWLSGKGLAHFITDRREDVRSWFPIDEFACRSERLQDMTPEGSLDLFLAGLDT
jgi:glycine/D-amino acid oxidase-like deaminating enzyme